MGVPSVKNRLNDIEYLRKQLLSTSTICPPKIDTAIDFISSLGEDRMASSVLRRNQEMTLIQPRGGFARFEDQQKLTLDLLNSGADFIPLTIDSHTRHNDYNTASILLERSELEDKNLLNGYPLVNHGYYNSRQLFTDIERPISLRHGTPDARLLTEVALASGISEIEGGALSYSIPYTRSYPVTRSLLHWQYVDRVCALVSGAGKPIHRESFGALTATLVPPVMIVVVELCELLLAAEQGVTSFSISFSQTGSVIQDLALAKVLRETAETYLCKFGFEDVSVYLVYHQWMGPFPFEYIQANALIATSALIGSMVGADKIITKTKEEARGIPTIKSNAEAVQLVRYVLDNNPKMMHNENESVLIEADRIRKQADAVMKVIFDLESTSFLGSVGLAFDRGYIDIPFSPHQGNKNLLLTRRGRKHGVYISDPGRVPLPLDTLVQENMALSDYPKSESYFKGLMRDINLMQ
jgi:methylaspartate mutase epsilon subunit